MTNQGLGLHWFRRDLRILSNPALRWNWKRNQGRVLGVFCFDSRFLSRPDFSRRRFAFFLNTLSELKNDLRAAGGDILILDRLPQDAFPFLINELRNENPGLQLSLSFNRDYEPFARARDSAVRKILEEMNVEVHSERDHLIIEPRELVKPDGGFYQIYTPFSKKWLEHSRTPEISKRFKNLKLETASTEKIFKLQWKDILPSTPDILKSDETLERFKKESPADVVLPETGSAAALKALKVFKSKLKNYTDDRNFPATLGTSRLSYYFKNGSLTTAQVIQFLDLKEGQYLKELIWREFYYHILWHRPDVEKHAFIEKYQNIKWYNDESLFKKWCEGKTGFPIVDAGMRELNQTGFMHNRVRMIVASFLTKDLLIDWRWGENYFMKMLLDGDLAPNNGGWQWAASTGCDPQPYFRIFNPWLQGEKFDPKAEYIKKYVPELASMSADEIHDPENHKTIVVHADQKEKALKLYKS